MRLHGRSLCACAGLSISWIAFAGDTRLIFEASTDGGLTYHPNVTAQPGATVYVQLRVQWHGTATVLGLAGTTYQPTLTNWNSPAGDALIPFQNVYVSQLGTPEGVGVLGKIAPWGVNNQYVDSTASGALFGFADPGDRLRISGSRNITPTTNLAWGVTTQQFAQNTIGTSFSTSTDCVVFRYAVQLGLSQQDRVLVASTPLELLFNRRVTWYTQPNGTNALRDTLGEADIVAASIAVPGPGVLAALCLAPAISRRRRA